MLTFITALSCEAQPLVDACRLRRVEAPSGVRQLYAGGDRRLAVVGVGPVAAAAGVHALLAADSSSGDGRLVNVGVCGARPDADLEIGELVIVGAVVDGDSGSEVQLSPSTTASARHVRLTTCSSPVTTPAIAPPTPVVDMEAAAICAAASSEFPTTCILCLKVVSDFLTAERLRAETVRNLVARRCAEILAIAAEPLTRSPR
jgi:nucleoside phosphorylase